MRRESIALSNGRISALPITDSRAYLWLAIAAFLGIFTFGRWTMAVAPWLHVLFSIRFIHTQRAFRGYVILSLVSMAHGAVFVWQGVIPTWLSPEILFVPGRCRLQEFVALLNELFPEFPAALRFASGLFE